MAHAPNNLAAEIGRKLFHLGSALIPLAYLFTTRDTMLLVLVPLLGFAALLEGLRLCNTRVQDLVRNCAGFIVRDVEWGRVSGATYVVLGAVLSVTLFPKPVAIAVLLILAISDSAAAIIGQHYGRARFLGKSLPGCLAFFLTALAILWIALPDSHGVAFAAALAATAAEATPVLKLGPFELNDNLMIPLITGAAISLMLP